MSLYGMTLKDRMKKLTTALGLLALAAAAPFALVGCHSGRHEHHHRGAAAAKPYPLQNCVVSGEAFDHGKPYAFVHEGQEIKLCCKDCLKDFNRDPAKYLSKLSGTK
ncbi:MAG: hypothetical protein HYY23_13185 [Verrucomicrobia bacterium]|nr:hypothetical protein [Verrucomicrobiota bacterium]